jgi:hypothetical protein
VVLWCGYFGTPHTLPDPQQVMTRLGVTEHICHSMGSAPSTHVWRGLLVGLLLWM